MTRPRSGLWTGQYLSFLLSTFVSYLGFQMLVPTISAHVTEIGGSALGASLSFSGPSATALVARAFTGNRMDAIGRHPILILGTVIMIVADLLLFLTDSVALICIVRAFQGIGWGMTSTALATIISDVVPRGRLGEGIGYFALSIVLATSVSIVAGIAVMAALGFPATLAASTIFFAVSLVLGLTTPRPPFCRNERSDTGLRHLLANMFEKSALLPAGLCFLHSITFSGIMAFIVLFGAEAHIEHVYLYFVGHVLMIVVSRPIVGRIYDRKGHRALVVPGVLSMMAGLVLLSWSHSDAQLVLASLFYGLGYGVVQPSLQTWAISRSPADRKGAANATYLSSIDLGFAFGAILTGTVASVTSYAVMYRASSLLLVVFLIVYVAFAFRRPDHGTPA